MKLIALDPGGTTGIAELDNGEFTSEMIGPDEHHIVLWNFLNDNRPDILICEEFQYQIRRNQGVDMPGVVLVSKEYIGVAKLWSILNGKPYVEQVLACLKFWDDDKLKKVGVYKTNAPHANDAARHLLYFVTFTLKDDSWVMKLKS